MQKDEFENTTKLIDEIYKNVRMASFAIDCIITKIEDKSLEELLRKQNAYYLSATKEIEKLSEEYKHKPVDINPMLKGMSFASIKTKTFLNDETPHIAEMLVQGATMGITDTLKSRTECNSKDKKVLKLSDDIVAHEEKFVESLKEYL